MVTPHTGDLNSMSVGTSTYTGSAMAQASQLLTPVNFEIPADACDCHTHIHGDPARFPFFAGRVYTPEIALPEQLAALHKSLHIRRVVIVTPSVYGTDNSSTLYGIEARGSEARGVAVIDEQTSERELDEMGRAGVCGIRLILVTDQTVSLQRLRAAIQRVKHRHWHVQVFANLTMIAALKELVAESPVPIVFDHFGGAVAEQGLTQPGFAELVEMVKSGQAYVKISAAYRISKRPPDYGDVVALAQALVQANPDRVLWGTDWPHPNSVTPPGRKPTEVTPLLQIDDGHLLNQLPVWVPEADLRERILVTNPARLYGF